MQQEDQKHFNILEKEIKRKVCGIKIINVHQVNGRSTFQAW